jgi:uncharacterized membrane protein YgcG
LNGATTNIEKRGLYDFDSNQQAIKVLDGKAVVTENGQTKSLGKNDEVLLASDHPLKRRGLDEKAAKSDPLYIWSQARSEQESQANASAIANAEYYTAAGPGWYWDPYWGFYGFWPADAYLYSPFGWGFYSPIYFGAYYGGYWGHRGLYGRGWYGRHGHVGGVAASAHAGFHNSGHAGGVSGFHGGGFGGGFHGGGFGGGGRH